MLTGKWLMTMFETSNITMVSSEEKSEKYSYEFISEMTIDKFCKEIDNFFVKHTKEIKYIILESDKIVIDFVYGIEKQAKVQLFMQMFKIHGNKFIFSLAYKEVLKS